MSQHPLTKLNAIALISIESGKSRRMVEATLKELTDNGTIRMEKSPHASVIYISRADVEKSSNISNQMRKYISTMQ